MADELKPNPFCGHAVMRDYVANDQWNDITGTEPDTCGMCEEIFRMNDEDWNRRPIEDALRAEVARQIKENESLAEANLTYAMETKELRDEVERLKVAEGEAMLVVESQDVSIAALRAEVAALKSRLAKFEGPLTEAQAHLVFCNAPTFDIMQAFQVDAAIRAAREGGR